jgi:hypothetical protein
MRKELHQEPFEVDGKQNRRTNRYAVEMRVRISTEREGIAGFWFGQANDISEFGMSLFVPTELEVGSVIRIEFTLPYCSQKLLMRGTVRNRTSFRYGIEFVYPTMQEREIVVRTCKMMSALQ